MKNTGYLLLKLLLKNTLQSAAENSPSHILWKNVKIEKNKAWLKVQEHGLESEFGVWFCSE